MPEQFEVRSGSLRIRGVFTPPDEGPSKFPCVVLSHGLISSKESSKYVVLSEVFQKAGIGSCRFDYHGCGESEGSIEETTLTTRISNLDAVVEWVMSRPSADTERIGLLGSSFGGCTSLVKAARDRRIACLSLWATPYRLNKEESTQADDRVRAGRARFEGEAPPASLAEGATQAPTIDGIHFKNILYEDFARYDLLAEAGKVSRALVIHGDMDETVPAYEGRAIYDCIREPKRFELIKGADHTFTVLEHRERAIGLAVEWFSRFLL